MVLINIKFLPVHLLQSDEIMVLEDNGCILRAYLYAQMIRIRGQGVGTGSWCEDDSSAELDVKPSIYRATCSFHALRTCSDCHLPKLTIVANAP